MKTDTEKIKISDLPEPLQIIAEAFGEDRQDEFFALCEKMKCCRVYFPDILKEARNAEIISDYESGVPVKTLTIRYDLSRSQVLRIIQKKSKKS